MSGSLTCQNLYDLSGSLDVLDAADIAKISNFSACLTFYNTFTWSSSQATALAALAKVPLSFLLLFYLFYRSIC